MVAVVLLVGIGVVAAVVGSTDEGDPTSSGGAPADPATANPDGAVGASDEVDDVGPCQLVDDRTVLLDITNNSSKQSNYIIDVNFLDAAGQRVADEPFFVNHVRPGERALEESFVFDSGGGSSCEIAEVDRFAGESPDDVAEVQCQVVGEDVLGDIATELVAANGSSKVSDYFISASLMRDGIRIGSADAFIENVRPGESAPGNGLSVTDGPAAGVTCEVVHVERTASE